MAGLDAIAARLTGPDGPFEMVVEDVLGAHMPVFKNRLRSLRALLEASLAHGEKDYLVYEDRRISYAEHLRLVASVARALHERFGVAKGDRVAILAANCPEWIVSFWAAQALGAVAVGLNGWWAGDEIAYGARDCDPKVLIADRRRLERVSKGVCSACPSSRSRPSSRSSRPTIAVRHCPTLRSPKTIPPRSCTRAGPRAGPRARSTRSATSSLCSASSSSTARA